MALCVYGKEPSFLTRRARAEKAYQNFTGGEKNMPSEKVLEAKKAQVAEVVDVLKNAQTGVIVDYRGLTVEEDTDLRSKLRAANVKYFVMKNTLLLRAAKEVGLDALEEALHGPTAIAVSAEDAVAPAKVLSDFAKNNEKLEIKSGFMDGAVMSLDEIKKLASTPNLETLIAKMMGSLNSPISSLARTWQAIVDGGKEISELIAEKAGEASAEAPAEETAAEEAPAEEKAEEAPAEEAPAEEAPAEEKAEEAPAEEKTEEAPAEETPAEETAADAE